MPVCEETSNLGLTAVSAGQTLNLNDRARIRLLAYDGLGLANTRRLSQRGPLQQGDTDLGYRSDPRFIDLAWQIDGTDLADYYALRETFLALFRPRGNDPVQLIFDFPGGRRRAVDVVVDGELDFPPAGRSYTQQRFSGVFKASDWRLYHPTQQSAELTPISEEGGGWEIDWGIPWSIGGSLANGTVVINYAGGSRLAAVEYPVMTLHGPIRNPVIANEPTGERIDLSANGGLSLATGEYVTIDLSGKPRRDSKTVRNHLGQSVARFLSVGSDLATFHLSYAGELLSGGYSTGSNIIRLLGEEANTNTHLVITWFDRYEGV